MKTKYLPKNTNENEYLPLFVRNNEVMREKINSFKTVYKIIDESEAAGAEIRFGY